MKKGLVRAEAVPPPDKRCGALSLAALAFSGAAQAVTLGDAEVRSALGEPLEARIPVAAASGEDIRGACFSLSARGVAGAPALTDAELALRRSARGNFLEVRSRKPVQDPSVLVSVAVACPGATPPVARDFTLLLDPPVRARLPARASAPAAVALGARQGDTLQSIARAIVPDDADARADYLRALRDANPQLAARGDDAAIGPQEKIALPDLRTYPRTARHAATKSAANPPSKSHANAASELQALPATVPAATPEPPARKPRRSPATTASASSTQGNASPFQLKLSAPEIDLSASRNIGERERAQLRERLAMLDADDQVAAMLSLRHSLKQLEARVAELQLKLSTMPQSLEQGGASQSAARPPVATAPAPQAAAVAPAKPEPAATIPVPATAKPEPAATIPAPVTAKPEPAPPPAATASKPEPAPATIDVAAPKPDTAAPKPPAPATQAAAPKHVEPAVQPPPHASKPRLAVANGESAEGHVWWWGIAAVLAIVALLWSFLRWRRQRLAGDAWLDEPEPTAPGIDEIAPPGAASQASGLDVPVVTSDSELPTRLPTTDAAELRRRYMEERFPELGTGMIDLEQAPSVVKAARLLYEDGAAPRAIELLQFALEANPAEVRHWLALFEIYRLERLSGEYNALAVRFQEHFGESEHWHKVRFFGREIDPGNPLFQEPLDALQTIGPRESRRLAAAASFDPLAENWLNAPMDFENEVLANELRSSLMQKSGMKEEDLLPNPTSALRNVEMFTVA